MNPDETLRKIRALADDIKIRSARNITINQGDIDSLVDAVIKLDQYLSQRGALPTKWQQR